MFINLSGLHRTLDSILSGIYVDALCWWWDCQAANSIAWKLCKKLLDLLVTLLARKLFLAFCSSPSKSGWAKKPHGWLYTDRLVRIHFHSCLSLQLLYWTAWTYGALPLILPSIYLSSLWQKFHSILRAGASWGGSRWHRCAQSWEIGGSVGHVILFPTAAIFH